MTAYYNEFDPFAAQWLRNLIAAGHIAPGDVDERDLWDVKPFEIAGYTQVHLCAGIGIWSAALRGAGWSDQRRIWTASFPCQPFSAAGKGLGFADERHLWPAGLHLINECRPDVVFGEQVSSKDGLAWFDTVQADLENTGYACGGFDSCAAGVGAPHIRQRLYWGAQRLEHPTLDGWEQWRPESGERSLDTRRASGGVADTDDEGSQGRNALSERTRELPAGQSGVAGGRPGPTNGFWRDADWLGCRDAKWRPVEPGTFPLADGSAARVGKLRGFGNGLVKPQAQAFVEAWMEVCP